MNKAYRILAGALTGFGFSLAGSPALAQSYPTGVVRIIVPFPAGGGVDTTGRLVGQKLTESLGKQFVIDNRGGATTIIGT